MADNVEPPPKKIPGCLERLQTPIVRYSVAKQAGNAQDSSVVNLPASSYTGTNPTPSASPKRSSFWRALRISVRTLHPCAGKSLDASARSLARRLGK